MFGIKTKKDKRIEHLESLLAMPVAPYSQVEIRKGDLIPYAARVIIRDGMPVEYAKEQVARNLLENMKHHIHFDISDADKFGEITLTGKIYVGEI